MSTDEASIQRRVGELVAAYRLKSQMSPGALARAAAVDVKTIRSLETGERWPQDTTRHKLEMALGLEPGSIARWRNSPEDMKTDLPSAALVNLTEQGGGRSADNSATWLADAVRSRRTELGLTQQEVYENGGPSDTTLTGIENGTLSSISPSTLMKLDMGLKWKPGSALAVTEGGQPREADNAYRDAVRRRPPGVELGPSGIRFTTRDYPIPGEQMLALLTTESHFESVYKRWKNAEASPADLDDARFALRNAISDILMSWAGGREQFIRFADAIGFIAELGHIDEDDQ